MQLRRAALNESGRGPWIDIGAIVCCERVQNILHTADNGVDGWKGAVMKGGSRLDARQRGLSSLQPGNVASRGWGDYRGSVEGIEMPAKVRS